MKRSCLPGSLVRAMCVLSLVACSADSGATDTGVVYEVLVLDLPSEPGWPDPGTSDPDFGADPNVHPYWEGATWDSLWPSNESARYQAVDFDQNHLDLAATVKEGMSLLGGDMSGAWTRVDFGTVKPNQNAMALFVDRKTPWRIRVKQIVVYRELVLEPTVTTFDPPLEVPLDLPVKKASQVDATLRRQTGDSDKEFETTYTFEVLDYDAGCTPVDAATPDVFEGLSGCAVLHVTDSGLDSTSVVLLHPTQGILSWFPTPGHNSMEMTQRWQ